MSLSQPEVAGKAVEGGSVHRLPSSGKLRMPVWPLCLSAVPHRSSGSPLGCVMAGSVHGQTLGIPELLAPAGEVRRGMELKFPIVSVRFLASVLAGPETASQAGTAVRPKGPWTVSALSIRKNSKSAISVFLLWVEVL